jgi:hypothetical protein
MKSPAMYDTTTGCPNAINIEDAFHMRTPLKRNMTDMTVIPVSEYVPIFEDWLAPNA